MRPVRFVALSEDGMGLILTDEVGRMLLLNLDDAVLNAVRHDQGVAGQLTIEVDASLTPRDIQARIRAGDSAAEVARIANVPLEKVLRFAGPVLQERAAMTQLARRTRLKSADGGTLGDVADARLREHGIDPETVAWDAYRRDNGSWRIAASWQSGKATARAMWDLDKARSVVKPVDDMAQFLSADREALLLAQDEPEQAKPRLAAAKVFTDDEDVDNREGPVVPALAVLRRERNERGKKDSKREATQQAPDSVDAELLRNREAARQLAAEQQAQAGKAALPTWDDILFGSRSD